MLEGLVQNDFPLTIQHILRRMRTVYGESEVVTLAEPEPTRATNREIGARIDKLAHALTKLGIGEADRVATFAWNSQRHLEVYYAAPCMGAVLHTLNIRLFEEQLVYIANHAEDQVVFVDDSLVPLLEKVAPKFETVKHYVVMGDGDAGSLPNVLRYEELLADAPDDPFDWPEIDERQAAGLCYTSGTTGNPKGVLYSHKSNVLHSFGTCLADSMGLSANDRMLPIVPMFHANSWGIPYAAGLIGASLVMPSKFMQAEPLAKAIKEEKVTVSAAVPTIWSDLLRYVDEHDDADFSSVQRIICGGSAVPLSLMKNWQERHGLKIIQAWGMTETSPLGSVARPPDDMDDEDAYWKLRSSQGRVMPLVEARIVDDEGGEVDWDGEKTGELEVRGPWVARDYYNDDTGKDKFDDGWLRTGDIAAIDPHGFIRISDRSKDVIKSGGEWISSVELEGELMAHPAVVEAAVIAKPDDRWQERPLACVVVKEGETLTPDDLAEHLKPRVAKWWLPDEYAFIEEVPKTSVGKFDKKVLRKRLADGELDAASVEKVPAET
jgi:fatty-acyl-CoA synthase